MKYTIGILLFLCSLQMDAVQAVEVYRCPDGHGGVSFQQLPCSRGGERIETGEAQAVWTSLRAGEQQAVEAYRRRDRERLARQRQAERQALERTAAHGVESSGCFNKRYALEKVEARLRHGYAPRAGERLRRRRDYLEEYLRRYCR